VKTSGVGKSPCACMGSKNIIASPSTKIAEFKVKNRRKSAKEAKSRTFTLCCFCYFSK